MYDDPKDAEEQDPDEQGPEELIREGRNDTFRPEDQRTPDEIVNIAGTGVDSGDDDKVPDVEVGEDASVVFPLSDIYRNGIDIAGNVVTVYTPTVEWDGQIYTSADTTVTFATYGAGQYVVWMFDLTNISVPVLSILSTGQASVPENTGSIMYGALARFDVAGNTIVFAKGGVMKAGTVIVLPIFGKG